MDFRKLFAALLVILLAAIFFRMIAPFLQSLFLAAIFSQALYPIFARIRNRIRKDGISALITTLVALLVLALPITFIVGAVSREAIRMTETVGPWVERQTGEQGAFLTLPDWLPYSEQLRPYRRQIIEKLGEVVDQIGSFIVDNLSRVTQGTIALALYLFVMLYAIFYFLLQGPKLLALLSAHLPLSDADQQRIVERGVAVTRATLRSILVIGVLQGALGGIAFAVVGIEGAVFWGLVIVFASAIPGLGAALIWVPAAVVLGIGGNLAAGIGLALWGAVVVSGVDNVLRPHLIGRDARMPDLLILVSTLGGIAMFGPTGLLIGPVLAGVFLTSLGIFAAAFRREFKDTGPGPEILVEPERQD